MVVDDAGAAVLAVLLRDGVQLVHDHAADALLACQQVLQIGDFRREGVDLLRALEDVFLVDIAQLDLRDVLGLDLVDAEADHQIGHDLRVGFRFADDADGLVDVEQDALEALEQMQLFGFFALLEKDPAAHTFRPPRRPFLDDLTHTQHARHPGDENVEVAGKAVEQRGGAEELLHELVRVDAAFEVDGQF